MTRFDEALQEFAREAEPQMRGRVASAGNRYVTVQEVGRARAKRTALQVTASLAVVALAGGAAWVAANQVRAVDPAAPRLGTIPNLNDPTNPNPVPFVCGAPFPYAPGITIATAGQAVPELTSTVMLFGYPPQALDVTGSAPALATESSVGVESAATWSGAEPEFWGLFDYAVLVDSRGDVVARTQGVNNMETGEVTSQFIPSSCADPDATTNGNYPEPLDGTYTVHTLTLLWVGNPLNRVAMWVDEDLPENASLTFDYAIYEEQQDQEAERMDALATKAKQVILDSGESLATVDGSAILPSTSSCAVASKITEGGLAAQPAMSTYFPKVNATLDGRELTWTRKVDANEPWWTDSGAFAVFFFDADGKLASVGEATFTTNGAEGDVITSRAVLEPYEDCGLTGIPTASGTYHTFMFVPYPGTFGMTIPEGIDLETLSFVSAWAPLGTYTVE